ncbi:MAG: type II toxin-antitoxin system VapC family toxin [Methylobacter sp.]|nr:type II toxin-antitoxin system VapC family toxin [Methylobacter sp.]
MIGLDTNVLVRYVAQDDTIQSPKASAMIESLTAETPGYVSLVSVVELVWVLTGCYAASKSETCEVLETLLRTREIIVAQAETVWKALRQFRENNADFADCLIACSGTEAGCEHTLTFDKGAVKGCGMRLLS